MGILFYRVDELHRSLLKIHAIVGGTNLRETYEFGTSRSSNNTVSTNQLGHWYQSSSSQIIIDYTAFSEFSNYTLNVECRNIELLHNQDALVYFQRKF